MCDEDARKNCGVFQLLKHVLDNPNLDPNDVIEQYQEIEEAIEEDY